MKALRSAGWDVLRGIDLYPEKTRDDIHFARAAKEQRVLVSNDIDMKMLAESSFLEVGAIGDSCGGLALTTP